MQVAYLALEAGTQACSADINARKASGEQLSLLHHTQCKGGFKLHQGWLTPATEHMVVTKAHAPDVCTCY